MGGDNLGQGEMEDGGMEKLLQRPVEIAISTILIPAILHGLKPRMCLFFVFVGMKPFQPVRTIAGLRDVG